MKPVCIFTALFLLMSLFSVSAQDFIVMRDGNIIEAIVLEIHPTEIRYRYYDQLDDSVNVVPIESVLTIRYENGMSETFNTANDIEQAYIQTNEPRATAINPDKLIFGFNANFGVLLNYLPLYKHEPTIPLSSGPSVNIEIGKNNWNGEINLILPYGGLGVLLTFNQFWHSRFGGAYFGGGIGGSFYRAWDSEYNSGYYYDDDGRYWYRTLLLTVGLNAGYKFVLSSGLYFRTGVFFGFDFYCFLINEGSMIPVFIKPDLSIGWTMR